MGRRLGRRRRDPRPLVLRWSALPAPWLTRTRTRTRRGSHARSEPSRSGSG
uniref:Uncharacterized protein n=1 Tax=uncultured marine virus TaxID=186617 RepID=A0A0F7LAL1_9VIRU|nr:hypothetical protein [uncultured marine virus]